MVPKVQNMYQGLSSIYQYIRIQGGPISIAQYMKYVLTNPIDGYYTSKHVIGDGGDFITSPEISQIFGEVIGVWILNEWFTNLGEHSKLNVIELGPGHGTLAKDLQRVFSRFKPTHDKFSFHMVESSPRLAQIQRSALFPENDDRHRATAVRYPASWYERLEDVPGDRGPCCFLANEFFDALPIHKYQKVEDGWREVMIGIREGADDLSKSPELEYRIGKAPFFPLSTLLGVSSDISTPMQLAQDGVDLRQHAEVSLETGRLLQLIRQRLLSAGHGSFGLICDYGHTGGGGDTFRAFKDHKLHDPLIDPGLADLTADVDFDYCSRLLRSGTKESRNGSTGLEQSGIRVFGPVDQSDFLARCGGQLRLDMLLSALDSHRPDNGADRFSEERARLTIGYRYLVDPQQMGQRFKFLAFRSTPQSSGSDLKSLPPPGFEPAPP